MSLAHRVELWTALAREAADLARDYDASFIVDADHAQPSLDVRMSAARGQARGLVAERLPFPAWEDGRTFLFLLSRLVDDDATPAVRRQHVEELVSASIRLVDVLGRCSARPRADLDD
ncbi:hypothetical protein [Caulobacter sp. UNC279MFTsu5.1]|uniref:hypothetical protein n=1 Tax=Caulobacter sp. UNC279MFTsu5.1 TaxID=1502775 RepID=UPI00037C40DA|nr:hypothetical protein [Caulobacter sp. UNC279MFTsu5.1]SFK42055.1 hypothetical protein SAMN02799626_04251 [Caulobacter sp. UNC279MFTsu5.1]